METIRHLTTRQVAERLGVAQASVRVWLNQEPSRFPNAIQEETHRGPVWLIPETDLIGFKVRGRGRPAKVQPQTPPVEDPEEEITQTELP
jgi:hypothetical protein